MLVAVQYSEVHSGGQPEDMEGYHEFQSSYFTIIIFTIGIALLSAFLHGLKVVLITTATSISEFLTYSFSGIEEVAWCSFITGARVRR